MGEIDGAFRAWGFAKDGTGGVTAAIASAARALGVEIRADAAVEQVIVRNGRAVGVALENGDELRGAGGDVRRRPEAHLPAVRRPAGICRAISSPTIENFRMRGSSGKVNIAL